MRKFKMGNLQLAKLMYLRELQFIRHLRVNLNSKHMIPSVNSTVDSSEFTS